MTPIKCLQCQTENKEGAKTCRKCGFNLLLPPLWRPTWEWHKRALAIIYIALVAFFFIMRACLKPYVRQLPPEITPWLHQKDSKNVTGK